jgi:hypothetical protein
VVIVASLASGVLEYPAGYAVGQLVGDNELAATPTGGTVSATLPSPS